MEVKISKAKLTKGGCLEATYYDQDGNEVSLKGRNSVHQDLRDALHNLVPFFTDLTEQKEADGIDWDNLNGEFNTELLSKIDVTGVARGGDENNPIITMTGKRILMTRRVLNLNTPAIEMDSETMEYEHIDDLDIAVNAFFYECEQYIVARKWAVVQQELNFDGDPDDPFGEVTPTDGIPVEETVESVA